LGEHIENHDSTYVDVSAKSTDKQTPIQSTLDKFL